MSISNFLKSAAVMSFGALLGYSGIKYLDQKVAPKNRFIASQQISKIGLEQNASYLFEVKLDNNNFAISESDTSTIKVNVLALKDLQEGALNYAWNLPQDVEVIEGATNDSLGEFKSGEIKEFILKVKGFSKQLKKYVSFEIKGDYGQQPIRREILISSRYEDSLEYLVQQNSVKQASKQNSKLGITKSKFDPENVIK
ncbi:MAG: hypothetical protein ABL930_11220 [Pseudobdellovibrio sp.]